MKNVFITGGAGFLGRALLRRLSSLDVTCTIFSRDHGKHSYCQREFPQHRYIIGDIRDYNSLSLAMAGHDTVIHAAAFKYVPQGETNVIECHEINVMGSLNVARAAINCGVDRVIGLSTDKACSPINVYGVTKLMMEKMFQEADTKSPTQFNLVRYGNVVSSTGSAVPIFRRQARETGVIKITNPDMTRFWLTVEDAVGLIMMALKEKEGGTIIIPKLPSLSLQDTADAALLMENANLDEVKFDITGQRFGEKVHESLISDVECHYIEEVSQFIYRLYPTTSKMIGGLCGYSSDRPYRFITTDEFIKMIKEAPA